MGGELIWLGNGMDWIETAPLRVLGVDDDESDDHSKMNTIPAEQISQRGCCLWDKVRCRRSCVWHYLDRGQYYCKPWSPAGAHCSESHKSRHKFWFAPAAPDHTWLNRSSRGTTPQHWGHLCGRRVTPVNSRKELKERDQWDRSCVVNWTWAKKGTAFYLSTWFQNQLVVIRWGQWPHVHHFSEVVRFFIIVYRVWQITQSILFLFNLSGLARSFHRATKPGFISDRPYMKGSGSCIQGTIREIEGLTDDRFLPRETGPPFMPSYVLVLESQVFQSPNIGFGKGYSGYKEVYGGWQFALRKRGNLPAHVFL